MKIAATVTVCGQVGMNEYADIRYTTIFEHTATIADIMRWAVRYDNKATFCSIKFSEVTEIEVEA